MTAYTKMSAEISRNEKYRYILTREWEGGEGRCAFIGLNPSTADGEKDDPTIRKCVGFARRWGFQAIDMLNLFAWRSTKPEGILHALDPVGQSKEDLFVRLKPAKRIVFAWGSHSAVIRKLIATKTFAGEWIIVPPSVEVGHLGFTVDGCPRHPLMLSYATPFVRFTESWWKNGNVGGS